MGKHRPLRRAFIQTSAFVAIAIGVALAAGPAAAQAAAPAVSGTIEYGYWGNARRTELTQAVIKAFTDTHPGTQVRGIVAEYQSYIERLTVQAAAKELPCVTQAQSTFLATYASRGVLEPLDDLVKSGAFDVSGIPPEVLETGKVDGKLYMIPTGTFLRLPSYNAALLKQYGIEEPKKRANFQDYKAWVLAAQQKLPKGVYATEADGAWLFMLDSWITGHGKVLSENGKLAFDEALLTEYLTYWKELNDAGAVVPADRLDEQFGAFELRPLARGRALLGTRDIPQVVQTAAALKAGNLPVDMKFARNSVADGVKSGNVPGANGLSISASCSNIPTAAAFINFFTNDAGAALIFQSANGVVVSKSGRDALLQSEATPQPVRTSLQVLAEVVADDDLTPATYPSGYQGLQDPLRRAYEAVVLQGQAPADAAKRFFREASRSLR